MNIILKNATIVTQNKDRDVFKGDVWVEGNKIRAVAPEIEQNGVAQFNLNGLTVIPGLIQTHVHLCQVLFRNMADDLELLDWLTQYIWPMEMAHTPQSLRVSAQLGLYEMLTSGVTSVLDMGCANHMDVVFEELQQSGIRGFCGKVMMDCGDQPYQESTEAVLKSTEDLIQKWHKTSNQRIQYALAPRFVLTCSDQLWASVKALSEKYGLLIHTHSSENRTEIKLVKEQTGHPNIEFFVRNQLASSKLCLAHCIWLNDNEMNSLKTFDINVMHCPAANLKLGSGFARIPEMLDKGINVSLGSDGAPCNNNLDIFMDMRLAALIHKPNFGVRSINAQQIFDMATLAGAKTLGMSHQIGSIEPGKLADLTILNLNKVHLTPVDNVISQIVYSAQSKDVFHVMVDGEWVVQNRVPSAYPNEGKIVNTARKACSELKKRMDVLV